MHAGLHSTQDTIAALSPDWLTGAPLVQFYIVANVIVNKEDAKSRTEQNRTKRLCHDCHGLCVGHGGY